MILVLEYAAMIAVLKGNKLYYKILILTFLYRYLGIVLYKKQDAGEVDYTKPLPLHHLITISILMDSNI